MNLETHRVAASGRFAQLLGDWQDGGSVYDQQLLETPDWVVAPTLGAIVPHWLIGVPRVPSISFKSWKRATGKNPIEIVTGICNHLHLPTEKPLWFEHGPLDAGTAVGCGVDYAHLHVLFEPIFTLDELMDQVRSSANLSWNSSNREVAYDSLSDDKSYLILGCGNRAYFAEGVEATGSQFLRRMVAATAGLESAWDYNRYPHHDNIDLTIKRFRTLERGAVSGV